MTESCDPSGRLVFGFHWLGGTATDVSTGRTVETGTWSYYGLQRLANDSAVFVAPQGLDNGWANSGGEDVTFVDDMVRRIDADLCIDTAQRFALGFSYGGAMTYALACSRPTVFRSSGTTAAPPRTEVLHTVPELHRRAGDFGLDEVSAWPRGPASVRPRAGAGRRAGVRRRSCQILVQAVPFRLKPAGAANVPP